MPSRQASTTAELLPSPSLGRPEVSVRCPATGATIAMVTPAAAVNTPSSSDSWAELPNAELDRYVLNTNVVATALNAENAQSQKPQAATAPRAGGSRAVTRDKLAGMGLGHITGRPRSGRCGAQVAEHGQHPPVAGVARVQPELGEDRVDLLAHRAVGDDQGGADLGVGPALGHQRQHVPFPVGQVPHRV